MTVCSFTSFDELYLKYYHWLIEKPVGTVIIFHGMAEHGARYVNFAHFLNKKGYDVYVMDFRGHGINIASIEGYFDDKNGWATIVKDIKSFVDHVLDKAISKNIVLLGHSMGSLLLRSYLIEYKENKISKVILIGTPEAPPRVILRCATILCHIKIALGGKRKPAVLMDKLIFDQYSKSVKNPRTIFDWLSHDMDKVMKYIADPLCGFICTNSFFRDLFYGINHCNLQSNFEKINQKTNILILSGSEDPVGDFGKAPQDLYEALSGVLENGNVNLKIYQGYRHEILNEVDCISVYEDVVEFIQAPVSS